jgi:hypothetical protein
LLCWLWRAFAIGLCGFCKDAGGLEPLMRVPNKKVIIVNVFLLNEKWKHFAMATGGLVPLWAIATGLRADIRTNGPIVMLKWHKAIVKLRDPIMARVYSFAVV